MLYTRAAILIAFPNLALPLSMMSPIETPIRNQSEPERSSAL